MTTFRQLVRGDTLPDTAVPGHLNPFEDQDALYESQILEISLDAMRSRAAVLLEFRTGFNFRDDGEAAAVWASGVTRTQWTQFDGRGERTAWNVMSSSPTAVAGTLTMHLGCYPDAVLEIEARRWWFAMGGIADLGRIPDYTEATDAAIRLMNPQWYSSVDIGIGSSWPTD